MPRRDPAKAVQVLDAMLEFFDGGGRWTRGHLHDPIGNRCLIGALRHVRRQQNIRGAGTEFYLHTAFLAALEEMNSLRMVGLIPFRPTGAEADLMRYNDLSVSYDEVQALIVAARDRAQAELDEECKRRRPPSARMVETKEMVTQP